ncbi:MAG: M1 family metallopeptidase [Anaerolineae bacterium]|nr:M1 family metallopeptidase [Anaerolineae bacterium]
MEGTLKHRLLLLIAISVWMLSCTLPSSPFVATPESVTEQALLTHTPTMPPQPTTTPVPTLSPSPPIGLAAFWEYDGLDLFEQAMRPPFTADVAQFETATRYWLDLRVDSAALSLSGTAQIRYTNQEDAPLDEIVVRLLPNLPGFGATMELLAVLADGKPVEPVFKYQNSAAYLPLQTPLEPGQAIVLTLSYESTLPQAATAGYAQYGYIDRVLALPAAYPLIPVYDDEGWNVELAPSYGDPTFSDTALYLARITLPGEMAVAASGAIVETKANPDGTATHLAASGPMRDFNVVASADYQVVAQNVDDVRVSAYYRTGDDAGGQLALDYAVYALRYLQTLIGPYPFSELDVMATPTEAGGIEYPGLIVVAQDLYDRSGGYFELVTAHEVIHQWWYSLVGNDQLDEPWLDEALTQYTTLLYFEERYGDEVAQEILRDSFEGWYKSLPVEEQGIQIGRPVAGYSDHQYGPIVYGKGPVFFHALRGQIGDAAFFRLLKAYFEQYRYGIAYPADLLTLAEQVSGQELDALYAEWVGE